jgi:hypothetical protein
VRVVSFLCSDIRSDGFGFGFTALDATGNLREDEGQSEWSELDESP